MSGEFAWPWQYNFPPFYTLQPNAETRRKQVDAWCQLMLAYHAHHKRTTMDVKEAMSPGGLFHNRTLERKLNLEFVQLLLQELQKRGNLEWLDKSQKQCRIIWRTTEEWGQLIYGWAKRTGHVNSVCTLFELLEGEDTENEPFHGLDKDVFLNALRTLEKSGKAEILILDSSEGVKFFS